MVNADSTAFIYTGRDNLEAMREAHRYNAYLEQLVVEAGAAQQRWLDFGAGTGQFAVPLTRKGYDIAALEPDALLVEELLRQGVRAYTNIDQIADQSIDFAYSLNVLEHIADDQQALQMLCDKLMPGGKLLVYVPAFQSLYSEMDRLVGHHRRYNKLQLVQVVRDAGFEVERCQYVDSLGYLASWLYRLLPNQTGAISARSVATYDRYVFPASQLVDRLASNWFGKNLVVSAHKRSAML